MGTEIERKFLVRESELPDLAEGQDLQQGYLDSAELTVRVRVAHDRAWLTLKGPTEGASRLEFEFPIPRDEAMEMLAVWRQSGVVSKTRYRVRHGSHLWEIDRFHDENQGLVMAEVELESESEPVEIPPWVEREVTGDHRYFNAYLAAHPFVSWV